MIKLLAITAILSAQGCAYVSYDAPNSFRAWTLFKDYGLRGVTISTNGLVIGSLSGQTDDAAIESAVRGATEGAVKGLVP
jgi:hypothetical protein